MPSRIPKPAVFVAAAIPPQTRQAIVKAQKRRLEAIQARTIPSSARLGSKWDVIRVRVLKRDKGLCHCACVPVWCVKRKPLITSSLSTWRH